MLLARHTYAFVDQKIGETEVWRPSWVEHEVSMVVLYGHALHRKWKSRFSKKHGGSTPVFRSCFIKSTVTLPRARSCLLLQSFCWKYVKTQGKHGRASQSRSCTEKSIGKAHLFSVVIHQDQSSSIQIPLKRSPTSFPLTLFWPFPSFPWVSMCSWWFVQVSFAILHRISLASCLPFFFLNFLIIFKSFGLIWEIHA